MSICNNFDSNELARSQFGKSRLAINIVETILGFPIRADFKSKKTMPISAPNSGVQHLADSSTSYSGGKKSKTRGDVVVRALCAALSLARHFSSIIVCR